MLFFLTSVLHYTWRDKSMWRSRFSFQRTTLFSSNHETWSSIPASLLMCSARWAVGSSADSPALKPILWFCKDSGRTGPALRRDHPKKDGLVQTLPPKSIPASHPSQQQHHSRTTKRSLIRSFWDLSFSPSESFFIPVFCCHGNLLFFHLKYLTFYFQTYTEPRRCWDFILAMTRTHMLRERRSAPISIRYDLKQHKRLLHLYLKLLCKCWSLRMYELRGGCDSDLQAWLCCFDPHELHAETKGGKCVTVIVE